MKLIRIFTVNSRLNFHVTLMLSFFFQSNLRIIYNQKSLNCLKLFTLKITQSFPLSSFCGRKLFCTFVATLIKNCSKFFEFYFFFPKQFLFEYAQIAFVLSVLSPPLTSSYKIYVAWWRPHNNRLSCCSRLKKIYELQCYFPDIFN